MMWMLIIVTVFTGAVGTTVTIEKFASQQVCEAALQGVMETAKGISVFTRSADKFINAKCVRISQ
jgi:hypothetical protein